VISFEAANTFSAQSGADTLFGAEIGLGILTSRTFDCRRVAFRCSGKLHQVKGHRAKNSLHGSQVKVAKAVVLVKKKFLSSSEVLVGRINKGQAGRRNCRRNGAYGGIHSRKGVVTVRFNNQWCSSLDIEMEGQVVIVIVSMDTSGRIKETLGIEESSGSLRYIV
jgi:hypothetical protein